MTENNEQNLTKTERLILRNQYAILEFLSRAYPEFAQVGNVIYHDPDTYHRFQNILEQGYSILMRDITEGIWDIDLSFEEQKEILNILDMYNDLQWSYDELEEAEREGLTEDDVKFWGWDGNSPKGELSFARLFCYRGADEYVDVMKVRPDRFERVKPSPAYNGHGEWLNNYKRMLQVFLPFKQKLVRANWRSFTATEIRTILDEFPDPDSQRGQEVRARRKLDADRQQ